MHKNVDPGKTQGGSSFTAGLSIDAVRKANLSGIVHKYWIIEVYTSDWIAAI